MGEGYLALTVDQGAGRGTLSSGIVGLDGDDLAAMRRQLFS